MSSPKAGYQRWLDHGGLVDKSVLRPLFYQIRKDTQGRADGAGRFRGSLIGVDCDRQQALSYLGADQNGTDLTYAVSGTWAHLRWQAAGLTEGWLKRIEPVARIGRWFKGTVDGITDDDEVFELKTTRSTVLRRMTEPKQMHLDQVTIYMKAMDVDWAWITYEGREDLSTKEFRVQMDWERFDKILDRVRRIKGMADHTREIPDMHPQCQPGTVMREYCSFRVTCLSRYADQVNRDS